MDALVFIFFVLVAVGGLALEAYGVITKKGTITESVRKMAKAYPPAVGLIALVVGLLFAHFFWQ